MANGTNKKVATETLNYLKDAGAMDEEALKKLEAALAKKTGACGADAAGAGPRLHP